MFCWKDFTSKASFVFACREVTERKALELQ